MKFIYTFFMIVFLFSSCNSMPVSYSSCESWSMPEKYKNKTRAAKTIQVAGVSVDRPGGWDSLEKEICALAPIYFWEQGYKQAASGKTPDYIAFINLREREFADGWHTRKSLVMEVRVWQCVKGSTSFENYQDKIPIAAGRIVSIGNRSFSSSQTAGKMLSRAVSMTVKRIPRTGR